MKRLHVHVAVQDLAQSVRFYSTLFASEPTVLKDDYAKWMLEDPRVNFAISNRGDAPGIQHLGIQVETPGELVDVYERIEASDRPVFEDASTACCYATSQKQWVSDPQGVVWETFLTHGASTFYGDAKLVEKIKDLPCCAPAAMAPAATAEAPAGAGCCAPQAAE
ncbi:ArsI/CadI family heavy metal resistance metalloenzyme [Zavarzinia sp. CC-PAN008]|uniref:ArsI/CadI family heavy metal resistance metalloenzyme n=1 Tax=Zavarzinia sp. CC-PAN008 TaxID=3243332 RepID=UPI003F747AD5